jgi:hypothetical protein
MASGKKRSVLKIEESIKSGEATLDTLPKGERKRVLSSRSMKGRIEAGQFAADGSHKKPTERIHSSIAKLDAIFAARQFQPKAILRRRSLR